MAEQDKRVIQVGQGHIRVLPVSRDDRESATVHAGGSGSGTAGQSSLEQTW